MATRTYNRYGNRVYSGMMPPYYDRVDVAYPDAVTETYAFSTKNAYNDMFELMAVITLVYTDDSKTLLQTAEKTWVREESD